MTINDSFEEIMQYAHFWNWVPDWQVVKEIYNAHPESYSVFTPFAYSYLEELIRSMTSEYGVEILDKDGLPSVRKVGTRLINLAIEENKNKSTELIALLEELKVYFSTSKRTNFGDNRNSVAHGYMHPRFWSKDSFEKLILDIARLSKFSGF
ncbi:hypothetical protein GCM10023189_20440 [Nibrella saemangeumensis]|uniref:DUF4145 domain-containing protein n=1 Tax=Nibrella saemangeumensis TaxID=1084526 RepID=A0ABP8MSR4_9BACT